MIPILKSSLVAAGALCEALGAGVVVPPQAVKVNAMASSNRNATIFLLKIFPPNLLYIALFSNFELHRFPHVPKAMTHISSTHRHLYRLTCSNWHLAVR
jgi:hypothetical protein